MSASRSVKIDDMKAFLGRGESQRASGKDGYWKRKRP